MKSIITRNIIKEIASKHNLDESIIKRIVEHPFKVLIETIRSGSFKNVRLLHLGVFRVKPSRFKYYKVKNEDITDKQQTSLGNNSRGS